MIDFVLGDREVRDRVERLRMEDRIDSDYQLVEVMVWVKGREGGRRGKMKGWRGIWEGRKMDLGRGWVGRLGRSGSREVGRYIKG